MTKFNQFLKRLDHLIGNETIGIIEDNGEAVVEPKDSSLVDLSHSDALRGANVPYRRHLNLDKDLAALSANEEIKLVSPVGYHPYQVDNILTIAENIIEELTKTVNLRDKDFDAILAEYEDLSRVFNEYRFSNELSHQNIEEDKMMARTVSKENEELKIENERLKMENELLRGVQRPVEKPKPEQKSRLPNLSKREIRDE